MSWSDFLTTEVSEIARDWAIVVGGTIGLIVAIWRGRAHNRQAIAQQQQARIALRGHTAEVFKDAVSQLGNEEKLEVRLGAVITLVRIAEDFPEFEVPVTRLLSAYVRERAPQMQKDQLVTTDIVEIMRFIRQRR
jgi:hypothetical protein